MTEPSPVGAVAPGFPRYFAFGGQVVNSYKVFLVIGICVGTFATAALATASGFSPLRIGLAAMGSALAGLVGARLYHVVVHAAAYAQLRSSRALWNTSSGGVSVFGALLTFIPASAVAAALVGIPDSVLWDLMGIGVLAGGFWIRLGCVFNGCCGGRETRSALGVRLHDTQGVSAKRIPVQYLEMGLWVVGFTLFVAAWPRGLSPGGYALAVLAWYGAGRFCLEPLREQPDVVRGRVRINQVVAGVLAAGAGGALILLYA